MIYKPPIKDIVFLLREWIGIKNINHLAGYEDLSIEDIELLIDGNQILEVALDRYFEDDLLDDEDEDDDWH